MSETPIHLDRDIVAYHCGKDVAPRVTVTSGSLVTVATHDARSGKLKRPEDVIPTAPDFDAPGHPKTNPVTGPIAVEGAEPGDALAVTILDITLDAEGFIIARPEWGVVKNSVPHQVAKMLPVDGNAVIFDNALRIPLRPNIGTIGTAPAGEGVSSIYCGAHGGNMDSNAVCVGTTVHLPVNVDLGLLFIGDVHAVMSDSEAVGTGCEIGATVTVKIELVKGAGRAWPWMETDTKIISYGAAPEYADAAAIAMHEMIDMVSARHALDKADAFMLIGLAGDLRVNQSCNSPIDISVRVEFPKHLAAAQ
ncbi:acetamidase/formamidase family protein [Sulfitobacter sp. 1A12779]|uniref:acetamidase/formamidase family protein n=1 Tax=Sulfitobacter sp. 1A12779 TaxID=3368599 RepID=UPI003744FC30